MLTFFWLARSHILLGDAAVYAHQIETANFGERSLHFLYYVVGWLVLALTRPLGLPSDGVLVVLSGILMTVALWQTWALYADLGEDPRTARWGLFILLFSGIVIQQATEAEIYALQLVFSLAAYRWWVRGRPLLAGIGLGLATLCSPLGVLAVGFFVADAIRARQWKPFLIMGVAGALTFLPVLAIVWRDYFYGTRGLLSDTAGTAQSWESLSHNVRAVARNFHWMLPFMVAGLAVAWRERSRMLALLAGLGIFHILAVITVTENGVFVLPLFPILTAIIARGVRAGLEARGPMRLATGAAVVLYAITSLVVWMQPYDRAFREGMMEGLRRCPPGSTVVSTWSFVKTLEFYGGPPRDTLVASRRLAYPPVRNNEAVLGALRRGEPVFLMEAHYPTRGVRWFYPPALKERHQARHALLPRVERALGVSGVPAFPAGGGPTFYRLVPR